MIGTSKPGVYWVGRTFSKDYTMSVILFGLNKCCQVVIYSLNKL